MNEEIPVRLMQRKRYTDIRCKNRFYYKAVDAVSGTCYGVAIKGDRDLARDSDKCRGRFFKPRTGKKSALKKALCLGLFLACAAADIALAANSSDPGQRVTPESAFVSTMIFYLGVGLVLALCVGLLVFAYTLLPKPVKSAPASVLAGARKVTILYKDRKIPVQPGSREFRDIVANFTDERKQADIGIAAMTMILNAKNRNYILQVSMAGWNFLGEEKASRRFANNLQFMQAVESALEKA